MIHTLKYFKIVTSQVPNFAEFRIVGYVEDVQILSCYNKKAEAAEDWVNKITVDEPDFWETQTQDCITRELIYKENIEIAKSRFNQTGGGLFCKHLSIVIVFMP